MAAFATRLPLPDCEGAPAPTRLPPPAPSLPPQPPDGARRRLPFRPLAGVEDGGQFAVVALPGVTPHVFSVVRDYLYMDAVDVRRWQAPAVARAARALGLPILARAAEGVSRSRRRDAESSFCEDMRARGLGADSVHTVACLLDSGDVATAHRTMLCCNSDFFGALLSLASAARPARPHRAPRNCSAPTLLDSKSGGRPTPPRPPPPRRRTRSRRRPRRRSASPPRTRRPSAPSSTGSTRGTPPRSSATRISLSRRGASRLCRAAPPLRSPSLSGEEWRRGVPLLRPHSDRCL